MIQRTKILFALLIVIFLIGCSKKVASPESNNTIERQIEQIKESANKVTEPIKEIKNETQQALQPQSTSSQTVYVPVKESQTLNSDYASSCFLRNYRYIGASCSFMDYWHSQSILLSWFVPYSIILFLLFILIVMVIIWLWRNRH